MKIEIDADIPEGYEATGEYRYVKAGEFYIDHSGLLQQRISGTGFARHIILLGAGVALAILGMAVIGACSIERKD